MQYISPIHFLQPSSPDQIDRKAILLARKKMLAELELNDGNGILINGKEVSKNDIIRFFDELQQSDDLAWHLAIYGDKILLKFLEFNTLEFQDWFAANPLYADASFITWISPFYVHSFVSFAGNCYRNTMEGEWTTLLGNPLLMNSYNMETAWNSLEKIIRVDISRLEFVESKRVAEFTKKEVKDILDVRRVLMLEKLPVERFGQVRDELAFAIMKLCIKIFNHVDRRWSTRQVQQAGRLAASYRMKEILFDKQLEMERIANKPGNRWSFRTFGFRWNIPRLVFVGFFLLARIATCNESTRDNTYNTITPTFSAIPVDTSSDRKPTGITLPADTTAPLSDSAARRSIQNLLKK